jgi:cell division protein FtsZ
MELDSQPIASTSEAVPTKRLVVKVFGVGSGGLKLLSALKARSLPGVEFIAVDTELSAVMDGVTFVQVENKLLRGLGTGGDPERGRAAAEEVQSQFRSLCDGANVVILLSSFGGGAGSGISPVLARIAKEAGALVLGFVATPFDCEGKRRKAVAAEGLQEFKAVSDGVICMPNQRVFKLINQNTGLLETFTRTNDLVADAVVGLWRLLVQKGLMEIRFEELAAVLRNAKGEGACASVEASGSNRAAVAVEKLLAHPMLDASEVLNEADSLLVSLTAGADLSMFEVSRVMDGLQEKCPRAQIMIGAAVDPSFLERLAVTVIAHRKSAEDVEQSTYSSTRADVQGQMLNEPEPTKPARFVAPASSSSSDLSKTDGRPKPGMKSPRKPAPRMRQGQLPLEIVSKGRFDKSEPTIHRGEDLDVPTYIRRGISLN